MGDVKSDVYEMGSNGTPQGSEIAPMLFSLIAVGVQKEHDEIPVALSSIYVDVTI